MKSNKKGFSLPLAMGIVILISLLAVSILEYIVPFSKDVKGIENGTKAYYQANSGIEEGLYHINTRTNEIEEESRDFNSDLSVKYYTTSSGASLPHFGKGNSEYNSNWNTISQGNPIQLSIGNNYITNWSNVEIKFRVPDLNKDSSINDETLSGATLAIVNWQLSAETNTLNASGSLIGADDVCSSNADSCSDVDLGDRNGKDLNGTGEDVKDFYSSNCGAGSGCSLKFSIINNLKTNDTVSVPIPYLEWKITTGSNNIPLRYSIINSSGKSYGFKKNLEVKVASQTVNEAFDFTVFQ